MNRACTLNGPLNLTVEQHAAAEPAAGQVRVRHTAIGVNFVDTYQRSGLYPMPLPFTPPKGICASS